MTQKTALEVRDWTHAVVRGGVVVAIVLLFGGLLAMRIGGVDDGSLPPASRVAITAGLVVLGATAAAHVVGRVLVWARHRGHRGR